MKEFALIIFLVLFDRFIYNIKLLYNKILYKLTKSSKYINNIIKIESEINLRA